MTELNVLLTIEGSLGFLIRTYLRKLHPVFLNNTSNDKKIDLVIVNMASFDIASEMSNKGIPAFIIIPEEHDAFYNNTSHMIYLKEPLNEDVFISEIQDAIKKTNIEKVIPGSAKGMQENYDAIEDITQAVNKQNSMEKTSKKILVVDDDAEARLLAKVLLNNRYEVIEAEDGRELVEKAKEVVPDLIISDIVMPGLSGWRAVTKIREDPGLAQIPVIFYSSLLKDYDLYNTLKPVGPSTFMMKPYKSQELLSKIEEILGE